MISAVLLALIVMLTLVILGVMIPSWTQTRAEDPQKNPHFTRRVFGMHK